MPIRFAVDLEPLKFNDEENRVSEVQIMPFGRYQHPVHGELVFDSTRAEQFAYNINNRVRRTDLDIDYDHKKYDGRAAGWIKHGTVRPDGLYATIEWTEPAYQSLKKGEYRYFSPEFMFNWTDPKDNVTYENVLSGGALTNRPFLKDIKPINLGEIEMDELLQALRQRYQLSDDASAEDIVAEVTKDEVPKAEDAVISHNQDTGAVEISIPGVNGTVTYTPEPVMADEGEDDELVKLAEDNPAIQRMLDEREADRKRIANLERANRFSEVNEKLTQLSTDDVRYAPVVLDEARKIAVELNDDARSSLFSLLDTILKDGIVDLTESRSGVDPSASADGIVDEAHNRIMALSEEKNISYRQAAKVYFSDHDSYEEYRSSVKGVDS